MLAALPDDKRQLLRDALSGKTEKELEGLVEQVQALMEPASPQRRVDDVDKSLEDSKSLPRLKHSWGRPRLRCRASHLGGGSKV